MKAKVLSLSAISALIISLLLCACNPREDKILDRIPDNVSYVGVVRAKTVLEQAGFKFEGERIYTPVWFEGSSDNPALVLLGKLNASNSCDINTLFFAQGKDSYVILPVNDRQALENNLEGLVTWQGEGHGFKLAEYENVRFFIDDTTLWLTTQSVSQSAGQQAENLSEYIKSASKGSIAQLKGVSQALMEDNLFNLASKDGMSGGKNSDSSPWAVCSAIVSDNNLEINASWIDGDGNPVKLPGLETINPAVLGYAPANTALAFVGGFKNDFNWSLLINLAKAYGNLELLSALSMMSSIDGTAMIAIAPLTDDAFTYPSPSNLRFVVMVHFSQEKIDEILNFISTYSGLNVQNISEGIIKMPLDATTTLYLGMVDGYLAASNAPFNPNNQNSLAPAVEGKKMAIVFDFPKLSALGSGLPDCGTNTVITAGDENAKCVVRMTGTDEPILETILKTLMR